MMFGVSIAQRLWLARARRPDRETGKTERLIQKHVERGAAVTVASRPGDFEGEGSRSGPPASWARGGGVTRAALDGRARGWGRGCPERHPPARRSSSPT
jgi:hypothetical protein